MGDHQSIFISYRRSDCQPQANGLYDGLSHRVPDAQVFMDIDSIPPGVDFEQHIRDAIEGCDIVLVMIGDNWLDGRTDGEPRRIDEPDDFVRLEIESALSSTDVTIIPVLVEGAAMPSSNMLPESIKRLGRINAIEMSDSRWTSDLQRLADRIEAIGSEKAARSGQGTATARAPQGHPTTPIAREPQPMPALTQPPPPHYPTAPGVAPRPAAPYSVPPSKRTGIPRWLKIALPAFSCGFASIVPFLMAAKSRPTDKRFRRRMFQAAAGVGAVLLTSMILIGSAPKDATGSTTGTASNIGVYLLFLTIVPATFVAYKYWDTPTNLPGTQVALARRNQRDQYRQLIVNDVTLARSMYVGRPDLTRGYDDGGLIDLNHLEAEALVRFAPMSPAEAQQIVTLRRELGRLSSLSELTAYGTVSEDLVARLQETAVFL